MNGIVFLLLFAPEAETYQECMPRFGRSPIAISKPPGAGSGGRMVSRPCQCPPSPAPRQTACDACALCEFMKCAPCAFRLHPRACTACAQGSSMQFAERWGRRPNRCEATVSASRIKLIAIFQAVRARPDTRGSRHGCLRVVAGRVAALRVPGGQQCRHTFHP